MFRVPSYRFRGLGFDSWHYQIFWVVGLELGPHKLVGTIEELLGRKSIGSGLITKNRAVWIRCAHHAHPVSPIVVTNFADKQRSLGLCISFADWGHGVCFRLLFVAGPTFLPA
jgi:hypothetical protein